MRLPVLCYSGAVRHQQVKLLCTKLCCETQVTGSSGREFPVLLLLYFPLFCPEKRKHQPRSTIVASQFHQVLAGLNLGSAMPLFDSALEQTQIKKLQAELQDVDFFNDKNSCSQDCILMSNNVFLF